MTGTSGLPETVKATEEWLWVVFGSCIVNYIMFPILIYIMLCVRKNHKNASKYLLITTFGYLICSFMYSVSCLIAYDPSFWGIKPSIYICHFIKRPSIVFVALSRYFFYEFCLLRIQIIFGKVGKYKCYEWQYIAMQILIHGYLIYHAIIFNILTTMKPHPIFGFCFATQKQSDYHVGIFIIWDAFIVFILLSAFSIKLMLGMKGSTNFKKKTAVLGVLSTLSSLMVTVLFFLGRMNRFVFGIDTFINSICMVFTYNMGHVTFCDNHRREQMNQSSTKTVNVEMAHIDGTPSGHIEKEQTIPNNSEIDKLCTP